MPPANNRSSASNARKGLLPLDPSLYNLDERQRNFLKQMTGITVDAELKEHIIKVQAKAYEILPYPCIRLFTFAKFRMSRLLYYSQALHLGMEREDALVLDIGCCFGSDLRKLASDGWPAKNMIASDLCAEFWEYGHELYKSTPASFPATFLPGDAFDPELIAPREPFYSPLPNAKPVNLASLTSLTPLQGRISVIHASLLFHLFDEDRQLELARRLAGLLSPEPGSMIFGGHYARSEKGTKTEILADGLEHTQFWHTLKSWKSIWTEQVFRKGTVKVEAEWTLDDLSVTELRRSGAIYYYMSWCITRL